MTNPTKVTTYEGVDVFVNEQGKFMAHINGRTQSAASLQSIKNKIKEAGIGQVVGRLEGLMTMPNGSAEYGYRSGIKVTILGTRAEKTSNRFDPMREVYIIPDSRFPDRLSSMPAQNMTKPNPIGMAKLEALHDELSAFKAQVRERAEKILAEEFPPISVAEVKKLLLGGNVSGDDAP
jgi:hypothetical protein